MARLIEPGMRIRRIHDSVPDKIYIVTGFTARGKLILEREDKPTAYPTTTWWKTENDLPERYRLEAVRLPDPPTT